MRLLRGRGRGLGRPGLRRCGLHRRGLRGLGLLLCLLLVLRLTLLRGAPTPVDGGGLPPAPAATPPLVPPDGSTMHSTRQSTPRESASACLSTSSLLLPTKLSRAPALMNETCRTLPSKPATWPFWLSRIQVNRRRFFTASRICGQSCLTWPAPCWAETEG